MTPEKSDLLADYREWAAAQPERISTHSDRCHLWHQHCMIHRLAAALQRTAAVVLTDAEREAVRFSAEVARMGAREDLAATLRGLLSRSGKIGEETQAEAAG